MRLVGNDCHANGLEAVVINSLSGGKLTHSPPIGLEPTTNKSHSLADQYLCWNFGSIYGDSEPSCRTGPPAYVAWRAGTTTLFLIGSDSVPSPCSKIPERNGRLQILGNYSFRPSTSSSLIVLSQIHC